MKMFVRNYLDLGPEPWRRPYLIVWSTGCPNTEHQNNSWIWSMTATTYLRYRLTLAHIPRPPPQRMSNPTHQHGPPWIWPNVSLYLSMRWQPWIKYKNYFDVQCSDNLWTRHLFRALFVVRYPNSKYFRSNLFIVSHSRPDATFRTNKHAHTNTYTEKTNWTME